MEYRILGIKDFLQKNVHHLTMKHHEPQSTKAKLLPPERPVHIKVEKFKNAALFLRLGLPLTLIRHENGAFRNWTLFKQERIWKHRLLVFVWMENILKTEFFENNGVTIIMWFRRSSFPQTQIQNDRSGDGCVFKFLRRNMGGKHLTRFQGETSVLKFLRCNVDGAYYQSASTRTLLWDNLCRNSCIYPWMFCSILIALSLSSKLSSPFSHGQPSCRHPPECFLWRTLKSSHVHFHPRGTYLHIQNT